MMKKILYSALTLTLGLVLSSSGCTHDTIDPALFDEGVEIGGVTWATRNVGEFGKFAAAPESAGMYYQWNRKIALQSTGPFTGWTGMPSNSSIWQSENDPCPIGWQVPTKEQVEKLFEATKTTGTSEGVKGGYFGTAPDRIFLPVTGNISGVFQPIEYGYYFSSTPSNDTDAHGFEIQPNNDIFSYGPSYSKTCASPIRCVKK